VADLLLENLPPGNPPPEIVPIATSGDNLPEGAPVSGDPSPAFGKGLFTRELDLALLSGQIDLAVHSLKDLPLELPSGLAVVAFCSAEDPRDALVLPEGRTEPDPTKPIGCSAARRQLQLAGPYPGIPVKAIRGNVPSRLAKLDSGEYGALVLALAGLKRLGLERRASRIFDIAEMLPAPGQGILAVVAGTGTDSAERAAGLDRLELRFRALAERSFSGTLGGGCGSPVAAFAVPPNPEKRTPAVLHGAFRNPALPESGLVRASLEAEADLPEPDPEELGRRLAFRLLAGSVKPEAMGLVSLVGAGPGNPGLLTRRAETVLASADAVVFDRLVSPSVLSRIPRRAEKIYAGKADSRHELPQHEINALLVRKALEGRHVVRLKGGDPMLFGRGGEEALCLADAGIPWTVVPGVPSAVAVPALAGIPVTHRDGGRSLHVVSAHRKDGGGPDFATLARLCLDGGTLVFLMGFSRLSHICRSLIDRGLPPETGAAVISRGGTAKEASVSATLARLPEAVLAENGIGTPALVVVGETCRLAPKLSGRARFALEGLRIAVTRPRGGEDRLAEMLERKGAEVVLLPTIRIVPVGETPELRRLLSEKPEAETWFAFTSAHGVDTFFAKLAGYGICARKLADRKFAAIGNTTCRALTSRGIIPDLVPEEASGPALGRALVETLSRKAHVVMPRSAIGGSELPDILRAAGIAFSDIPVYDILPETGYENPAFRERLVEGLRVAAFTSPSAVEAFATLFGAALCAARPVALCIGGATAEPAQRLGMTAVIPTEPTLEGMVEGIAAWHKVRNLDTETEAR